MTDREKLYFLIQDSAVNRWFPNNEEMLKLADHLIANGVTVQEERQNEMIPKQDMEIILHEVARRSNPQWISVKDRLPDKSGDYIVYYTNTASNKQLVSMRHFYGETPEAFLHNKAMTHWMPLPEPPKEGTV